MGVVNSLGSGVDHTFNKLSTTTREAPQITNWDTINDPAIVVHRAHQLPELDSLSAGAYEQREARSWPLLTKAAAIAVHEAVQQSNFDTSNVATLISSIGGGNDMRWSTEQSYDAGKTRANPFQTLGISYDYTAGAIATKYQWSGPSTVMVSACASGLYTLDYAIKCLDAGDCEVAVVGGTDAMVDRYNVYFFQVLHALSRREGPYNSQPFSAERDGFVLGEGAGILVVETLEHALNRNANILAEICGMGFYTETEHPTTPSENGTGAMASATKAVERSGLRFDQIDFINAHATSTPIGDAIEYNAMNALFPNSIITAAKGHIGHTMSACGIIELIYGIKSLQTSTIFPVANFTGSDIVKELAIATQPATKQSDYFIKNSYGFGGKCASVVIGRYE
jgi:3-oxoacyl-[acyl-carrier-protein] synthase II